MNKEDLEYDISIALDRWSETASFTLAGVDGLTRSDLDVLLLCCDYYDQHGTLGPFSRCSSRIMEVLKNYGML